MRHFSPHRIVYRAAAIVTIATQLVACGSVLDSLPGAGGSSESTSLGSTPSRGTLSGVAKDALIRNAKVRIYAWDGAKGELLGSGSTDERGKYSLQLETRSQPVLLEVSEGVYTEEVTLKDIFLTSDQALYAVQNYTSGRPLTTAITYYTTLATGLAEHLVRLGMSPPDAVVEANKRLSGIIGVDTSSVIPTDILAPDNFSLPELQYGFATAALSSLTERASILNNSEPHIVFTSISFIQSAYDDVRADGVLNGRGVNGEVAFGRIRLTPKIYRNELALHILRIANNTTANRTGRSPMDMFDLAQRLNSSTDPIFGGEPIIPIDSERPNVSPLVAQEFPNIENNAVVFGGVNFTAMVAAFPGAAAADLLLDDMVIGTALDPENPSIRLETFNPPISEGLHTLKLRVTDISGAVGESPPLEVNISNQQTAIANISIDGQFVGMETLVTATVVDPAQPRKIEFSVRPQGATEFVPVDIISPSGGDAMVPASATLDPQKPSALLDPQQQQTPLPDGDAIFKVEVTNSVGFVFAREVPFVIDLQAPLVNLGFDLAPVLSPEFATPGGVVGVPLIRVSPGRFFDRNRGTPCTPMQPFQVTDPCLLYVRLPFGVIPEVSDNRALDRVTVTFDANPVGQPLLPAANAVTATSTFRVDPTTNGQSDGRKVVAVTAVDKARNTTVETRAIVVDRTPPNIANFLVTRGDGADVLQGTTFGGPVNISARVEDTCAVSDECGITVTQLRINGTAVPASAFFTPVNQFNRATLELSAYDTSNLADGDNEIVVEATDRAGNTFRSSRNINVDNTAPVITVMRLRFGADRCRIDGTVSDPRFDSLRFTTSANFQSTPVTGGTGGDFSIGLTNNFGTSTFTLEAMDTLGNVSTRTFTYINTAAISLPNGAIPGTCEVLEDGVRLFMIPRTR